MAKRALKHGMSPRAAESKTDDIKKKSKKKRRAELGSGSSELFLFVLF